LPSPVPPPNLPYKPQLKTGETITPKEITKHKHNFTTATDKAKKFYRNGPLQDQEKQEQESIKLEGTEGQKSREADSELPPGVLVQFCLFPLHAGLQRSTKR
jgi:hypothetical protein